MLRCVMIGCGAHAAEAHASPLKQFVADHPGVLELAAACDVDLARAENFCRQFGFARAFNDFKAMVETVQPDAAWCIVPPTWISSISAWLLTRGIPTVIEKPPGATVEQARELAVVAKQTGTTHMVSVNRRFATRLREAVQWARQQGPIRYVRCAMLRKHRIEPGFLTETGIHAVDAMRYIGGDVASFSVSASNDAPLESRWRHIDLLFTDGARGRIDMLPSTGCHAEDYEFSGEGFRVELRTQLPLNAISTLRCWRDGVQVIEQANGPDDSLQEARGDLAELAEFIDAISTGRPARPTVADIVPSLELCHAIETASA